MYMTKYPCVYMRGGTSKAVFFHEKDLPKDQSKWDEIFLKVMGSPDVKQIDGMGGTVSSTSKIAIISPSDRDDVDVNYTFRQVDIVIPRVDGSANCGNISVSDNLYPNLWFTIYCKVAFNNELFQPTLLISKSP